MKLGREHVVLPDHGGERRWIVGLGSNEIRVFGNHIVGVYEINSRFAWQIPKQRSRTADTKLVPAHVRHFEIRHVGKAHHLARKEIEPVMFPVFVTLTEEQLQAETDSQEWFAGANMIDERLNHAGFAQTSNGIAKGA